MPQREVAIASNDVGVVDYRPQKGPSGTYNFFDKFSEKVVGVPQNCGTLNRSLAQRAFGHVALQ
jgi:hypothetical protein